MPPDQLEVPALQFLQRHPCGLIRHEFFAKGPHAVIHSGTIRVSPRIEEPTRTIVGGDRIVLTKRRATPRPDGCEGVLLQPDGAPPVWLAHRLRDDFTANASAGRWSELRDEITASWEDAFRYHAESRAADGSVAAPGLRPPQLGALHALGAHWSLYRDAATVVMPTGTGKTEVVLAALIAHGCAPVLVVVPSGALRDQTAEKFTELGRLRGLGTLGRSVRNPIVGVLTRRPTSVADLDIFERCHVVVATMSAVAQGTAAALGGAIAQRVSTLIVDEAHHVPADTWTAFREHFEGKRVIQLTATPFRRDGQLVDGEVVFNYPLGMAQRDGYFKPITFRHVYEIDQDDADRAIATAAAAQLREDRTNGLMHLVMARCGTIARANDILALYERLAPETHPVLIHSEQRDTKTLIQQLRAGAHQVVVCVDMLGEGFDLPELKIAAIHDTHKSLGVLLQFTGRFTRSAGPEIGDATVIANIADPDVSAALERLYSEDADWNRLLSEFSSEAIREHLEMVAFLRDSGTLDDEIDDEQPIAPSLLRPMFSAVAFEASRFTPRRFIEGLPADARVMKAWLHAASNTLYFVTRRDLPVDWSRSKELNDRQWDLFVLHHDPARRLLYVHSSDKSSLHERLAEAVAGSPRCLSGDPIFRVLGRISRLQFYNIGVRKHGRRNLRYAMYTGADVATALSITETSGSVKNNLFGSGFESGRPATIGCSLKGRVWSRQQGSIPECVRWAENIGDKLRDASIDTGRIIDNVLIPEEVDSLPDAEVLSIDWPDELLRVLEERVTLSAGDHEEQLGLFGLQVERIDRSSNGVFFKVASSNLSAVMQLQLGVSAGYEVTHCSGDELVITVGRLKKPLAEYLSDYPPLLRLMDLSELDGDLHIKPKDVRELEYPLERLEPWDWTGTDIQVESMWRGTRQQEHSIQERLAQHFADGQFGVVFDDDGPGEAADLVCLKEEDDCIRLALVHCKFSSAPTPGARVGDLMEVAAQAVRSARWKWRFRELCRHVVGRERRLRTDTRPTRFVVGAARDLNRFVKVSRFKPVEAEILVVQPGLSKAGFSSDQKVVLAGAYSFIKETSDVELDCICSD